MPESGTNFSENIFIIEDILFPRRGLKTSPDENSGALSVGCKRSTGLAGVACCPRKKCGARLDFAVFLLAEPKPGFDSHKQTLYAIV